MRAFLAKVARSNPSYSSFDGRNVRNQLQCDFLPVDLLPDNLQDPPRVFHRICTAVSGELPMHGPLNMRFYSFVHVQWVFTLGLSLSSVVDVVITATLCYYLHRQRTRSLRCVLCDIFNDLHFIGFFKHGRYHRFISGVHV